MHTCTFYTFICLKLTQCPLCMIVLAKVSNISDDYLNLCEVSFSVEMSID